MWFISVLFAANQNNLHTRKYRILKGEITMAAHKSILTKFMALLAILFTTVIIAGCGDDTSDLGGGIPTAGPITCNIPCITGSPILSTTSISSATGGSIDVTVTIDGNLSDVRRLDMYLLLPGDTVFVDYQINLSPSLQTNTYTLTVPAGTPTGTYYVEIGVGSTSGEGVMYSLYFGGSTYTYTESLPSGGHNVLVSEFTVPFITVY